MADGTIQAGLSGANWSIIFPGVLPLPTRNVTDIKVSRNAPTNIYVALAGSGGDRVFRLQRTGVPPTMRTVVLPITADLPSRIAVNRLAVDPLYTIYAATNEGVWRGKSDNGIAWLEMDSVQ